MNLSNLKNSAKNGIVDLKSNIKQGYTYFKTAIKGNTNAKSLLGDMPAEDLTRYNKYWDDVAAGAYDVPYGMNADEYYQYLKGLDKVDGVRKIDDFTEGTGDIQKTLSKRVDEIRKQLPNSKLRNQGNMATANVDVPGIKKDFVAHSQINSSTSKGADLGEFSYLKPESERMFKTYAEAGKPGAEYSRYHDTEVKILEDIASQIDNPNIYGTINLYTEAPACQSCTNVIFEFKRTFPNIKLNIYAGE